MGRDRGSRWLARAVPAQDGLLIPSATRWRSADLRLTPDGVVLSHDRLSVDLPWTEFPTGWDVTQFSGGAGLGTGVTAFGSCAERIAPIVVRTVTVWDRWGLASGGRLAVFSRSTVPLQRSWRSGVRSRSTLRALCQLLAGRPKLRPRLLDDDRMRRLAVDLGQARVEVSRPGGLRTTTTEVFRALDHLGYVHPLAGRPLPCEALPEREKVVERVIERVDRRFLGDGPELRREKVERLVRRYYLDVEPWPFAALTC